MSAIGGAVDTLLGKNTPADMASCSGASADHSPVWSAPGHSSFSTVTKLAGVQLKRWLPYLPSYIHTRQILWDDDPYDDFNATEHIIYSQYVSAHFVDIEQDVDQIGETIIDVKLPYDRLLSATGDTFTTTWNHLVRLASRLGDLLMLGCCSCFNGVAADCSP